MRQASAKLAKGRDSQSLIDIYPTLIDLCNLQGDTRKNAQGAPLMASVCAHSSPIQDQAMGWARGASPCALPDQRIIISQLQHWAYRTERYRYIIYNNGKEELYDHANDPHEWDNLANIQSLIPQSAIQRAIFDQLPYNEDAMQTVNIKREPSKSGAELWKDKYFKNTLKRILMETAHLAGPNSKHTKEAQRHSLAYSILPQLGSD